MPTDAQIACERLRDGLRDLLGDELIALWVHGAATFPDRPDRLGDVDTYGFLAHPPDRETASAIDELHGSIAADLAVEWDSWYVLQRDAAGTEPPRHAFREKVLDEAWALHRAHWLSGQYVVLFGGTASELVQSPTWKEITDGLRSELLYIERVLADERNDARHAAYAVWNGCRIIFTLETEKVVISKKAAANWALEHVPEAWHPAIRAAGRIYDGGARSADESNVNDSAAAIVSAVRERLIR